MTDPSILVIGPRIPEGLSAWATGNGYAVHHAARASDGLERFDKVPTSLVIVQLRLDQLADLAYVARLRELPAGRTVPIVALCRAAELDRCKQFASALRLNLWLPEPLDTIALAPWANPLTHAASGTFTRRRSGVLGEVEFTGRSPSSDSNLLPPRPSRTASSDSNLMPPRPSRTTSSDLDPAVARSPLPIPSDEPGVPRSRDSRSAPRSGPMPPASSGPPPAVTTAAWPGELTASSKSTPPGLRAPPTVADEAPAPRHAPPAASPTPPPLPSPAPPAQSAPVASAPAAKVSPPAPAPDAATGRPELVETKTVPEYVVPTFDEVDALFADD